ncbi:FHA domain protein [Ophiocordyceps sinensis CO18]|uniref:FHA domain protein n=1 Tax=Ophiocordyceps sinensis (strain Co18 / CGMCC 3.14243) TaxID=911162 RepID=T5AN23_OPHSC|nr:FHA domain protein [Ophiocordyceps sinensis CO18]
MALPQFSDEVQVVLSAIDPPGPPCVPSLKDRFLLLTKEKPTASIGRTSKRDLSLEPARNNAWIDSAVMSRAHAMLHFHADAKKVCVKDVGSLHGTFYNGVRLATHNSQHLQEGDTLTFGIPVERSMQAFPPCTMRVSIIHGTEPRPENKPVVFRVPDDTDIEDMESDDDFSVRESTKILHENGFHPAQSGKTSNSVPIDLTSEDGEDDWQFDEVEVIEGVDPNDWNSCSSVESPATSPVPDPRDLKSSITAPAGAPGKGPDPALDDDDDETDGDESLGFSGFNITSANLPTGLPSLTGGYDDVGLEGPKATAEHEMIVPRDLLSASQRCVDSDSTMVFSSPAAQPTREPETQQPCLSPPVLDETSAYQFELSKKAAATNAALSKAAYIEPRTDPERPSDDQPSRKRKAEEISEPTPEEERIGIEASEDAARTPSMPVICAAHARSLKALVNEVEGSRPSKRLRRAAEVFGFAAIGGVAVISALIATAPAL